MSAAKHADVLFVKDDKPEGHNDLAAYVKREGIKCVFSLQFTRDAGSFTPFTRRHILIKSFTEALPIVQSVVKKEKTVIEVLSEAEA